MATPTESVARFNWFGTPVHVRSDDPTVCDMLRAHDPGSAAEGAPLQFVAVTRGDTPRVQGPRGSTSLDPAHAAMQAYSTILRHLLGDVGDHFVFHASTVARDGRALVVAGPSSFGKTTLAIHLALRGFSVLSEDLTFVERAGGRVVPFRRPMTVRPGTRRTLEGEQLDALERGILRREADVWSVDAGRASVRRTEESAAMAVLAVMRPTGTGPGVRAFRWFTCRVREGCQDTLASLRALPGNGRILKMPTDAWAVTLEIADTAEIEAWIEAHADDVVLAVKHTGGAPDFAGAPAADRIGSFQAGLEISQEMLNRHPGSRVAEEFEGRETHLVADVAALLRGVECYALSPGVLEDTLDLLEAAFTRAAR